jgi:trans-aconitate 2-methyltransferase
MEKWDAKEYRKNSSNQYRWGVELAKKAGIKRGDNVLDIGCGDGRITAIIAKSSGNGRVMGADSSAAMLKLAKKMFPPSSCPNLRFVQSDARKLRFNGGFDVVFSNACLHWVHEHDRVLAGVNKVLKPGGRIFFQMGGKTNAYLMSKIMQGMIRTRDWEKYFRDFKFPWFYPSPAEYRSLLKRHGLKPVRVFLVPKVAEHKGADGLFAWMKTTWLPYAHRVPARRRNAFISQAVQMFLKATKQAEKGIVRMPMMRLQVEAVKS